MKIQKLVLSTITSLLLLNSSTFAQEVLDPIVVSSDFRTKNLSKTASSVSILSQNDLASKSSESFENVVGQVPNVNFTSGASRAHFIQIRGIGERSQFKSPVNPSVGLIIDGIDVSDSALALTLFDIKQVEVLKGPQGTTFGSNGMAGVVSLKSNEPTKQTQGHIEGTYGNYNTKAFGFAIGGSVIENKLLARVSAYKKTSDGFMKNKYLNKEDTQNIDELTSKIQFKYLVNDKHAIDLNYIHVDVDNGYDAFTFDNSRTTQSDKPGTDAQKTDAIAIKSTYHINNNMNLESKVSFSKTKTIYSYDEDWSYVGFHPDEYSSFDEYKRDKNKKDIDLRLVSKEDGKILKKSTDWIIGAYYKDKQDDLKRDYTYLSSTYKSSFDTKNIATYGQLDTALNNKLKLTTGLRLEKWDAKFNDSDNLNIDTDENLLGGTIGLSYQEDKNNLYYVKISKGYKPGGVNADNSLQASAREFKTEHLWNLDIGKVYTSLDNKLKARVNAFYGLRKDQQVKSSVLEVRNDSSTNFIDYLANAAKSHYYGLETQLNYKLNDELKLFASLGLLKSKFDDYEDPNPSSIDVNGRAPAQSPEYQYKLGMKYMLSSEFLFNTSIEGKDSYYFSNRHNEKANSYALVNASLAYFKDDFIITLWGKNLTDEDYQTRGFGSFPNNPANGWQVEKYTQQGDPRTFGITMEYDF